MTEEQASKVAELRAVIVGALATREGVPPKVRRAAVALKREMCELGSTARPVAVALGVSASTLIRWERDEGADDGPSATTEKTHGTDSGFRVVTVASPRESEATSTATPVSKPMTPRLRVTHAASGLVVDGLDVETLVALLRRMS